MDPKDEEKLAALEEQRSAQTTIPKDLWVKTQVILSQAEPTRYVFKGPDVSIFTGKPLQEPDFVDTPNLYEFVNKQVDLLKKLSATFPPEWQALFPKVLIAQLSRNNGPVVAHTLVDLRHVNVLREWSRIDEAGIAFWSGILQKLRYEHWTFSADDLQHVYSGMSGFYAAALGKMKSGGDTLSPDYRQGRDAEYFLRSVRTVITKVQYVRLAAELTNVQNPVLDTD